MRQAAGDDKTLGGYTKPLIVDKQTGAILDGHHRHSIAFLLGLKQVPALCVDYLNDERIEVDVWPNSGLKTLSKEEVVSMSLSGLCFPPKTSRHIVAEKTPPIFFTLDELRQLPPFNGPDVS